MRRTRGRRRGSCAGRAWLWVGAAIASLLLGTALAQTGGGARLERISLSTTGAPGNDDSVSPAISADGRFVAFTSTATNLVAGDTHGRPNVFVRDRLMGTTELISVSTAGTPGNGFSRDPTISAEGRFVAFVSEADDLVPSDNNGLADIFVRDRLMGTTERVSVASDSAESDGVSLDPAISADGRFVAFGSNADDLVPGDTNEVADIFVRDRTTGTTERVSISSTGAQGNLLSRSPAISADGQFVAFISRAGTLVVGDRNNSYDVFIRDRRAQKTELVSRSSDGTPAGLHSYDPAISADGRYVAFVSEDDNLVPHDNNGRADVFVRDRAKGETEQVSFVSGGRSQSDYEFTGRPPIGADGRYVAFSAFADRLVPQDTNDRLDVFVRDRMTGRTELVSLGYSGIPGDGDSQLPAMTPDGRFVAFASAADNLVPGDTNGHFDVFVWDRLAKKADLTVDPTQLGFGRIQVGTIQTRTLSLRNVGPETVTGSVGALASPFSVTEGEGVFALAPGTNKKVTVEFAPTRISGPSEFQATLTITSSDPLAATVPISVTGESFGISKLVVEPIALTFPKVPVGETRKLPLTLRNTGMELLTGSVSSLDPPFGLEGMSELSLAPGKSQTVMVTFAPTRVGRFQATLAISSSDPDARMLSVPVTGEAIGVGRLTLMPSSTEGLRLTLTPPQFAYGECQKGSLLLQNSGTGPLRGHVESLPAPFAVLEGVGEFVLQPGESRKLVVQFCAPVGSLPRRYETTLGITLVEPEAARVPVPLQVALP